MSIPINARSPGTAMLFMNWMLEPENAARNVNWNGYPQPVEGGRQAFAKLAKEHSEDPASAKEGGKFTAQKGATVAPFDKVAFELETGELSEPVKTQFGWHIIEAVGDIEEASTQPLTAVEEQISTTLLEEKKNARINEWVQELQARFADLVVYAPGFEPPPEAETTSGETDTATD